MTLTALDRSATPPIPRELECDSTGALRVTGVAGGASGSSSGLTDSQLRASPVPVSGPLTDTQLRATAVPVAVSGVATAAKQDAAQASLSSIDTKTPALVGGASPVVAVARSCVGRQTIPLAANTVTTLTVPGSAVAANIQADGGTVRITQDGATAPSSTVGTRIDDGVIYYVDTALASVKLLAPVACSAQVCYFDKA